MESRRVEFKAPRLGDALIAASLLILCAITAIESPPDAGARQDYDLLGYVLIAGQILPLLWRQRYPRIVLWLSFASWFVSVGIGYPYSPSIFAVFLALYSVAAYLPRAVALRNAGALLLTMSTWTVVGILTYDATTWASLITVVMAIAVPVLVGLVDFRRRERLTELEVAQARRTELERAAAADAVRAERARIARELHDVVAHEMTVMTLQAEGAKRMAGDVHPRVTEALGTISESGRKGLTEMQRMIGVLRASEQEAAEAASAESEAAGRTGRHATPPVWEDELSPMPSLAALPTLVQKVDDSGLPVDLQVSGSAHVPAGVELSAYRIVQEALTNAMKHAGPGAHATVTVRRRRDAVTVTVEDDGRGVISDAASSSGGHGLAGMRERVAALGGTIECGARKGGGFRVHAVLPSSDDRVRAKRTPTRGDAVGTLRGGAS